MNELTGYIKLYRKLTQWGWYQNSVVKDLFLHCLLKANFQEFDWNGQIIKPGQFVTSYRHLAEDLGFSVMQIRTALKKLENTKELTYKTTNKFTIITIENWASYQSNDLEDNTVYINQITNKYQSNNNQITNKYQQIKNDKNDKNDKNEKKEKNKEPFPPSLSSILQFIKLENLNVDGEKFYLHYSKTDWKNKNGEVISDWRQVARNWEKLFGKEKEKSVWSGYPDLSLNEED